MITDLVSGLGKRIEDRWAGLIVLPGLVFTLAVGAAYLLGQGDALDARLLVRRWNQLVVPNAASVGDVRAVLLLTAVLALSAAAALAARAVGGRLGLLLTGTWPSWLGRPERALRDRRRRAWQQQDAARKQAPLGTTERAELALRRNRVSLVEPTCPTWTGDRLRAPAELVWRQYRVSLVDVWPQLWLLLPDSTRTPLTEARGRLDDAFGLAGWAVLYAGLGVFWWPSALIALAVAGMARGRARAAAASYAQVVEATVDVHLDDLLDRFDPQSHPVRATLGPDVTVRLQKGTGPRPE